MKQSTFYQSITPLHVAIIMDGNGRWAQRRGQPRLHGHKAGGQSVRRTVEAALELGIGTLTLHAFSSDNWKRPREETRHLMRLFREYLRNETARCSAKGIRLNVIGRRDRLTPSLLRAIEHAENATRNGGSLLLRIAVDYSARDSLIRAVQLFPKHANANGGFALALAEALHGDPSTPDVDLLIRTGGEQRFSDLFGWDSAYAEVIFTETMWPDFGASDLREAIEAFQRRDRRFGALPAQRRFSHAIAV